MTSSSPTPDIASLSLSSQPPHQRLHDTYDFDGTGTGNVRNQYHFATSPPVQPSQSPFHHLSMNQSPLKTKTSRAGLPSVRSLFFSHLDRPFFSNIIYPHMHPSYSNGSMAVLRLTLTIALCLLLIILIFLLVEVLRLSHTSTRPQTFPLPIWARKTRLYPRPLSSKTSLLMSNARPSWTSSYVLCHYSLLFPLITLNRLPCPFQLRMHSITT